MAKYVGGPCDGQTVPDTIYATSYCGGVQYIAHEDGDYYSSAGVIGVGALGKTAPLGWADLRRTLSSAVPTRTRKAQLLARAAHRAITNRRRHR